MPNFYSTLRRFALTTLLGGGGLLSAQAQLGQTLTAASNVAGTYTDLGTTGTVITTTSTDDANSAAQNIGFSFAYNKLTFTQFVLNTNGVIRLGSAAPSTAALYLDANVGGPGVDPLLSTNAADANLIMPFNTDLVSGTGGAEYRVFTTGTTGSRVCTIQWKNVADKAGSGSNIQQYSNFSFQVKLYENGRIEFVYGTATASTAAANTRDTNVGLKGSSISTGQLLLADKPVATAWSAATFRTSGYGANTFAVSKTLLPDAGRTYRFNDPAYCAPGVVTSYPYLQNFDGVTAPALPCGITTINVNNDTGVWANLNSTTFASSAPNCMQYNWNGTNAADDWFFTQGLTMTVGQSYQLQFKYRSNSTFYNEALEVKVGSAATVAAQTTTVFSKTDIQGTSYTTTAAGSAAGQVTLFTPTTTGVYYFGFHAISIPNQLNLYVDDLQVTEVPAPACPQPTALVVGSITTTTATVTFNGPTNGTAYKVIYVPRGTTPTATSPSVTATTSPATLTGLTSNTNYDVYVQATCGTSGTSISTGPVSFLTACAIVTSFPYTENFDGVTAPTLPCGVTTLNVNNDSGAWTNNSSSNGNTTPNAMRYNYNLNNAADDWFFTNGITMTVGQSYQLQFKYKSGSTTYSEALEVKVGNAATVAAQTTTLFSNTNIQNTTYSTTATGVLTGQIPLFTPTTTGVYYFGFHAISIPNQLNLYVDDLQVTEVPTPACPQPTALVVSSVTTTTATVTFNGPATGTAYKVIYVPRGTTPTATSPSITATTSPATLTGLTFDTFYDVYVQATCGTSGTSISTGPVTFRTACPAVTTFPYIEKFDGVTAPTLPCGITTLDANNDNKTWVNTTGTTSSTPNAMRYTYNSSVNADDWFFTNALSLQAGSSYQLEFKYRSSSTTYVQSLEVKAGTSPTAAGQTTTVYSDNNINTATYTTTVAGSGAGQVAVFTPTTTGLYYFGFHATSAANFGYLYVDDVQVTLTSLASCPTPTGISVNGITDTQAQVSFTGPSIGTAYTVIYVPRGTAPTASSPTTTGTNSPITLTGLTPNTNYDIYVRGTCGASGQGLLGGPVSFTTACLTTSTFPYTQNFDGVTAPVLPCGITTLDVNADGSTWVNSNDQPSSGVNSMRYLPSAINNADDWFFTGAMRLTAGVSYQLQFKYRVYSYNYPERMEVKIGMSTTAASQTTTLFSNNNMLNDAYVTTAAGTGAGQVASFVPTTSGIYFIGFHAISTVNSFSIYVDDVNVTATTLGTRSNVAPGFSAEASPVPFSDHLNLTLNTLKAGPLQLTLHDAVGRVVRETTATVPAGASSLAVPGAGSLPAGMYILTVRQGGNTQVIRVAHE
jgi:hypothetical protein